jgi:hypothetical protein
MDIFFWPPIYALNVVTVNEIESAGPVTYRNGLLISLRASFYILETVFSCCLRKYSRFFEQEPFNMSWPTPSQSPCSYSVSSQRYRNAVRTSADGMVIYVSFINSVTLGNQDMRSNRTPQIPTCLLLLLPLRRHRHQGRWLYLFWSSYNKNSIKKLQ